MRRKPYTNPAVESAVRKLEKEYADAFRQLRRYLERELAKLNRDGQILVRDRFNIKRINDAILPTLQAKARELGFGDILKAQTEELKRLARAVLAESKELTGASRFTATTGASIKELLTDAQRVVVGEEAALSRQLEYMLRRSITGNVEWMDLVKQMENQLGLTQRQAMTKAMDNVASFHNMVRVEHFEDRDSKGNIQGIEWWLYDGPRDDRNRDFCAHFVGTRVTTAILDSHAASFGRKHPAPASMSLGGYACRHELVPLTAEAMAKYPVGPLSPGRSRTVRRAA